MNAAILLLLLGMALTSPALGKEEKSEEIMTKSSETATKDQVTKASEKNKRLEQSAEKKLSELSAKDKAAEASKASKVSKGAKPSKAKPLPEISIGSKDAPVVMIMYSSLSCGHCAKFNTDILPEIDKKYIKKGYLRVVFRDFPGDQISLRAHQLAWCKGEIKYMDFIKQLYAAQEEWLLAPDPLAALKAFALKNGMSAEQFESCFKNPELLDQIVATRLEGQKKYNITATPTIVINAKVYQRTLTPEEIDGIMKPFVEAAEKK